MAQSFLHPLTKSVICLLVITFLTACGGGGGGGGGGATLPNKVALEFPASNELVDASSQDFEVRFTDGAVAADNLKITLNGIDVTPSFKVSPTSAKASVYALSGILKDGNQNFFNAKAISPASAIAGVQFRYDAKPEVILTTVTGLGPYVANGASRKATLDTVTLNGILTSPTAHAFTFTNVNIPTSGALVTTTPDFTVVATDKDGDVESIDLVVPKAKIKYGAGVQLNSSAFNVLEKWVAEILEKQLPGVVNKYITNPHLAGISAPIDLMVSPLTRSASACELINLALNQSFDDCGLYLTKFTLTGLHTNVVVAKSADVDKFILRVTMHVDQVDVALDTAVYQFSLNQGAMITDLSITDVSYTVDIDVSNGVGIVKFFVPDAVGSFTPYSFVANNYAINSISCSSSDFCGGTDAQIQNYLNGQLSAASATVENAVKKSSNTLITPGLNTVLAALSVDNKTKTVPIKNDVDVQVSSINFELFGTAANASMGAGSACTSPIPDQHHVCGGFIGLGGSTYADDSGTSHDNLALGSYFDPLDIASVVGKGMITSTGDVMIALSENSMNQLLLGVYQSRLLAAKTISLKIGDLGTAEGSLGKNIVDSTASIPFYNLSFDDDINIAFDLEAVPRSQFFKNSLDSGLELSLYALRIKIDVYRNGIILNKDPLTGAEKTNTVNMLLDVKALLHYGLNVDTSLPQASVDKNSVVISVQSLESISSQVLSEKSVLEAFPAFLASQIENFVAGLTEPIVSNVDLKGLGLVNKSSWLVIDTLAVDAKNEFILLNTRVVDIDPATPDAPQKKGIFQLNVTDSCESVPKPAGCLP